MISRNPITNAEPADVVELGRSVAERVASYLEAAVLDGRIEPGVWLREVDLAKQLGVSRTPLREAFLLLVKKGLLEVVPRRGARVRLISDDELTDILSVRLALDGRAAKLAAERLAEGGGNKLERIVGAQRSALRRNERSRFHDLGQKLHAAIYLEAGNPKLQSIYESLAIEGALHRLSNLSLPGEMETTLADHEKIVAAIVSGNGEAARAAAEAHIGRVFKTLRRAPVVKARTRR
jgi:DNA-binding GntR family transcriptional regulator